MKDFSHCPTDAAGNPHQYFSPVAPPEYCVTHQVPEPSSLALVLVALVLMMVRRKA